MKSTLVTLQRTARGRELLLKELNGEEIAGPDRKAWAGWLLASARSDARPEVAKAEVARFIKGLTKFSPRLREDLVKMRTAPHKSAELKAALVDAVLREMNDSQRQAAVALPGLGYVATVSLPRARGQLKAGEVVLLKIKNTGHATRRSADALTIDSTQVRPVATGRTHTSTAMFGPDDQNGIPVSRELRDRAYARVLSGGCISPHVIKAVEDYLKNDEKSARWLDIAFIRNAIFPPTLPRSVMVALERQFPPLAPPVTRQVTPGEFDGAAQELIARFNARGRLKLEHITPPMPDCHGVSGVPTVTPGIRYRLVVSNETVGVLDFTPWRGGFKNTADSTRAFQRLEDALLRIQPNLEAAQGASTRRR